jgi:hypothetical protein
LKTDLAEKKLQAPTGGSGFRTFHYLVGRFRVSWLGQGRGATINSGLGLDLAHEDLKQRKNNFCCDRKKFGSTKKYMLGATGSWLGSARQ